MFNYNYNNIINKMIIKSKDLYRFYIYKVDIIFSLFCIDYKIIKIFQQYYFNDIYRKLKLYYLYYIEN